MTKLTTIERINHLQESNKYKAHCKQCGRILAPGEGNGLVIPNHGKAYYCDDCINDTYGYYDTVKDLTSIDTLIEKGVMKNDNTQNKINTIIPITYGCEMEFSIPYSDPLKDEKLRLARQLMQHGFLPSHDGSVDIEYKSPIINNLNGLAKMFKAILDDNEIISDSKAGNHINVWCDGLGWAEWGTIQNHYSEIFGPLYNFIVNEDNAHHDFFGRGIGYNWNDGYYAGFGDYHECMINMQDDKSKHLIELRIAKYKNATQYLKVVKFWGEVMKCIVVNFINHAEIEYNYNARRKEKDLNKRRIIANGLEEPSKKNNHKAIITGGKILKIYKKYRGL